MRTTEKAAGKINLFLDIASRRSNGYHNIESIMHTVPLYDTVTLELKDEISVSCTNPSVPSDSSNLAYKAAKLFFEASGISGGVSIHIDKKIPMAGGMAGGSTDAAATLRGLNRLYDFPLSNEKLEELGAKLGADVPFCIRGGTEGVVGIGYDFIKVPTPPRFIYVIACGGEGISTPAMYREYDERYCPPISTAESFSFSEKSEKLKKALENGEKEDIFSSMFNCFEEIAMEQRPKIREIKQIMTENGADFSMMSGSGPSVFGIFSSMEQAKKAEKALLAIGVSAFAVFDE